MVLLVVAVALLAFLASPYARAAVPHDVVRVLEVSAVAVRSSLPTIEPINPNVRPSSTPGIPDWFGLVLLVLIPITIVVMFRRARARGTH